MTAQVRVLLPVKIYSFIAQSVERTAVNREVVGSIPAGGASDQFCCWDTLVKTMLNADHKRMPDLVSGGWVEVRACGNAEFSTTPAFYIPS